MKDNFDRALKAVLVSEGGYVNHPKDPGGATNKGVTQRVYDAYRLNERKAKQSVRLISAAEIGAIYRELYWDRIRGDNLPAGVDYAVFDLAVNSGVSRAAKFLQAASGVMVDGAIGPATIRAARADAKGVVERLMKRRIGFLRALPIFSTFGRGWTSRCNSVAGTAMGMCT